jgi:hypothetical protein
MDDKTWSLLEKQLNRIENELNQNSKETTEIRAKVFNGMSSKIDTTFKTVQKLYDEFDKHVEEEKSNLTIHFKAEFDKHHKDHHKDDLKEIVKTFVDGHKKEFHDDESQQVIKKAKEASVVADWTKKYTFPIITALVAFLYWLFNFLITKGIIVLGAL